MKRNDLKSLSAHNSSGVEDPTTRKKLTLGKMVAYGVGIAVTAPVWVPLYCITVVGAQAAKMAMKHPRLSTLGMVAGGTLWYHSWKHDDSVSIRLGQKVRETVEYVRDRKMTGIETRLQAVNSQQEQLYNQLQEQRQYSSKLEEQLRQAKEIAAQGSAGVTAIKALETELRTVKSQQQYLDAQLQEQREYSTKLDEQLTQAKEVAAHNSAAAQVAAKLAAKLAATPQLGTAGYIAYYLKPGESLSDAAVKITGSAKNAEKIREWSQIPPDAEVPTGRILWVHQSIASSGVPGTFVQVPKSFYETLPPNKSIREEFRNPAQLEEVLLFNKSLGLAYSPDTKGGHRPLWVYYLSR